MNLLLILAIFLFIGLVVVHELGHFIAARRGGVEVEEFGIGFPPRAWAKKLKSGLVFSLNWLPIGGFVRLKGENDADKRPGSFGAAPLWTKVKIMLAGVTMNLVTAFVILTLLAILGMPQIVEDQYNYSKDNKVVRNDVLVGYIAEDSPAEKATVVMPGSDGDSSIKLERTDKIKLIRSFACGVDSPSEELISDPSLFADTTCLKRINTAEDLPAATTKFGTELGNDYNAEVVVTVVRGEQVLDFYTELNSPNEIEASKSTDDPKGYLGISPTEYTLMRSTWSAPIVAGGLIKQFTELTLKGIGKALWQLVSGRAGEAGQQVAGPVGIVVLLSDGSSIGYHFILMIIAIISLTLAIMNALPIPALDGGRLFVTLLFRAIKKPLTKSKEEWIHGTGFALLMLLFVLITVVDVRRNF